ncbi:hypothetical protein DIPPA_05968 [Diplonema papillatum]|nr:hypothetical protein DIPPA_05968 [Diplonema papillatum]
MSPPLSHLDADAGGAGDAAAVACAAGRPALFLAHRLRSGSSVHLSSVVTPKEAFFYDGGMLG